jgi:hypothetical protein
MGLNMEDKDVQYEHGARKLQARPEIVHPNPVHTGDPADDPKYPYGLTEPAEDRGDATGHHDGVEPGKQVADKADPAGGQHKSARRPL